MSQEREVQDRRGLRFPFNADAEILVEGKTDKIPARLTELSFRGCFLETSVALKEKQHMRVKVYHADQYFEASAHVMYLRPNGVALLFANLEPHFRNVLQDWILTALDKQAEEERS